MAYDATDWSGEPRPHATTVELRYRCSHVLGAVSGKFFEGDVVTVPVATSGVATCARARLSDGSSVCVFLGVPVIEGHLCAVVIR